MKTVCFYHYRLHLPNEKDYIDTLRINDRLNVSIFHIDSTCH